MSTTQHSPDLDDQILDIAYDLKKLGHEHGPARVAVVLSWIHGRHYSSEMVRSRIRRAVGDLSE